MVEGAKMLRRLSRVNSIVRLEFAANLPCGGGYVGTEAIAMDRTLYSSASHRIANTIRLQVRQGLIEF